MSTCSSSVTKYFIIQPEPPAISGQTVQGDLVVTGDILNCSGGTLYVNNIVGCTTGVTINGNQFFNNGDIVNVTSITSPTIYGTTFSGGTFYGDGSNLTGISTIDSYMTGGTYNNGFITFSGSGNFQNVTIDVSQLLDDTNDGVVSGATLNNNILELSRTQGLNDVTVDLSSLTFTGNTTGSCITDFYVTNIHGCSPINMIDDTIFGGSLTISPLPSPDNSLVQILGRDSTSGLVKYRDVNSIISAATSVDTYVTGFTLNGNTLNLGRNQGEPNLSVDLSSYLDNTDNYVTGGTMVGNTLVLNRTNALSAVTVDLSQFLDNTNYYVTGSTLNGTTLELSRNGGLPTLTTDLSTLVSAFSGDTFVTGLTFNSTTYDLTLSRNSGQPNLVSNLGALASDIFVMSGVYNPSTGIVTYTYNSGQTFEVSGFTTGMTDSYTTDAYLSGNEIRFDNNIQGSNLYNVDLTPILSGFTSTDYYVTGGTVSGTDLVLRRNGLPDVTIDASPFFDDTNDGVVSGATLNGNTLELSRTQGLDDVTVDLSSLTTVDTFVTGATLNVNTLELGRNQGQTTLSVDLSQFLDNTDNYVTGGTYSNGFLYFSGTSTNQIFSVDVSPLLDDTNTYVTGTTFNSNQAILTRNDSEQVFKLSGGTAVTLRNPETNTIVIDVDAASNNFYVTGGTLQSNSIEIGRTDTSPILTLSGGSNVTITNPLTDVFLIDSIDTGEINTASNIGVGQGVFSGKSNTDLQFYSLSGGSNINLTLNNDTIVIDGTDLDTNDYITGGTLVGNTLVLDRTDSLSAVTVDLSSINTDNYITGGTMVGNTLVLDRTDSLSAVTVDLSQFVDSFNDTFVTGVTIDGSILSIGQNQGKVDETVDLSITRSFSVGAEEFTLNTANRVTLTPLTISAVKFVGVGADDIAGITISIPEDYSSNLEWYNVWRTTSTSTTSSGKTFYEIFTGDTNNLGTLVTSVETVNIIDSPESTANVFIYSPSTSPSSYIPKAGDTMHLRVYRDPGDSQDDFSGDIDLIKLVFKYTAIR
jgi:hypothetical protein